MKKIFSVIVALCAVMALNAGNQQKVDVDTECGQTVKISATPQTGFHFVKWEEDGNTENPRFIENVKADATFTAVWEPNDYTVTVVITDQEGNPMGGSVAGAGGYKYNADCTLAATADECYKFVGWYNAAGELVSEDLTMASFKVTDNVTYTAKFEKLHYTITVISEDDAQGTVAGEVQKN